MVPLAVPMRPTRQKKAPQNGILAYVRKPTLDNQLHERK
jgi:hypothetical protein